MLSPTRLAAAFAASCIRWTYRAVVDTFRWPSSFPIAGRLSPSASALDAIRMPQVVDPDVLEPGPWPG